MVHRPFGCYKSMFTVFFALQQDLIPKGASSLYESVNNHYHYTLGV